jgi:hypothetical protein
VARAAAGSGAKGFGEFHRSELQGGARPSTVLARKPRGTMAHEASDVGARPILGRSRSTANALEAVGLPPGSSIPRLTRSVKSLTALPLDPRAAFVAGQIDGHMTVQNILDLGLMTRAETVGALDRLVKLGVVVFA